MNRRSQFSVLCTALMILSGCSTVTDMVTSNIPEGHSGRPSIVVSLRAQEAYLYRAGHRTASSRISSGREGYRTPVGRFQVIRKDEDHRSSVYGDYVNGTGHVRIRESYLPVCPHHMDASGCLIGKRASFTTPSTLAH